MVFKVLGSFLIFSCGALYAHFSSSAVFGELEEANRLLRVFSYLKNEIEEFGTPLNSVLLREGIDRGVEGLLSSVRSKSLLSAIGEARGLGRGHKKGDLRICARIISRLEEEKRRLEKSASEARVLSRVKGFGTAAAAVILFL